MAYPAGVDHCVRPATGSAIVHTGICVRLVRVCPIPGVELAKKNYSFTSLTDRSALPVMILRS